MTPDSKPSGQPGILTLELADKAALYSAYMPFINNGGLFIPVEGKNAHPYSLGDEVFLLLHLNVGEQSERIPIAGKVVWLTPPGAQGQRKQGIGIQFSNQDGGSTQQKIESILAGSLNSDRPTQTL